MKTLKFRKHLVTEIQEGRKTVTWRLFDDKNLEFGDRLELLDWESGKKFAEAEIMRVREKKLWDVEESDFYGHEKFQDSSDMLRSYREYYGEAVTMDTPIKMIDFKILHFCELS